MEDPELCRQVVADIEMLKLMGVRIVLVHGGGKAINAMLKRLDVPVKFKDGLARHRRRDHGGRPGGAGGPRQPAAGLGSERVRSQRGGHLRRGRQDPEGRAVDPDLGRVGRIREVDTSLINTILDDGYIPVVATVGCGPDGFYNINADVAADKIAEAMGADKLIYLTDVDGLFRDFSDEDSLVAQLTRIRDPRAPGVRHLGRWHDSQDPLPSPRRLTPASPRSSS